MQYHFVKVIIIVKIMTVIIEIIVNGNTIIVIKIKTIIKIIVTISIAVTKPVIMTVAIMIMMVIVSSYCAYLLSTLSIPVTFH